MSGKATLGLLDRTGWSSGPWDDEPDRVDFRAHGFPCFVNRNRFGSWCGYVGVPVGHPYYGEDYDDLDVVVHGGLTYASKCQGDLCHTPEPGESDDVWWLGFDCGHAWDKSPGMDATLRKVGVDPVALEASDFRMAYRTLEYVREETENLAEQLAAKAKGDE